MKEWLLLFLASLMVSGVVLAGPADDVILSKVIRAYQLQPLASITPAIGAKERLGQALFFDPLVSGPKRIACAACHVRSLGAGDGLPMAVGLGGATGVGKERLRATQAFIVPRNTLPFFNRGAKEFRALFWDGRVQIGPDETFESPLGSRLPKGFESILAVAAVFPIVEPDEMLGRSLERVGAVAYHGELLDKKANADDVQARTLAVFETLVERLLVSKETVAPNSIVQQYRELFYAAYPGVGLREFRIHHIGNALAAYITAAFALQPAAWDRYVSGDISALSEDQKQGAIVFFGKGRCAVCHSGTQFSDFRFHGLAIPQQRVGKHTAYVDYGRAGATARGEDRFLFRTPPLRNVAQTSPYGHNGTFASLQEIVEHHINPVPALYAAQQAAPEEASQAGRLLGARSPILAQIAPLSRAEIERLVLFLHALSSKPVMPDAVAIPARVPSGDDQFVRL